MCACKNDFVAQFISNKFSELYKQQIWRNFYHEIDPQKKLNNVKKSEKKGSTYKLLIFKRVTRQIVMMVRSGS